MKSDLGGASSPNDLTTSETRLPSIARQGFPVALQRAANDGQGESARWQREDPRCLPSRGGTIIDTERLWRSLAVLS